MGKKKYLLFGISIAILVAIIWLADPVAMAGIIARGNVTYIIAAFLVSSLAVLLRVAKWRVLLKGVGFLELFPIQLFGMAVSNLTPGKVAEPAKIIVLKMQKGIAVSSSLVSIIWERVIDVIILIIFGIIAVSMLSLETKFFYLVFASMLLFIALVAVLIAVMWFPSFGMRCFRFLRRLPLLNRISENFVKTFYETRMKKSSIALCFLFTLAAWVLDGVAFFLVFLSLGIYVGPLLTTSIIALSLLIGIASSLPGGIGSFEVIMIMILGLLGHPAGLATAAIMLSRFLTFWYNLFLGGLSFFYLSKKVSMKNLASLSFGSDVKQGESLS